MIVNLETTEPGEGQKPSDVGDLAQKAPTEYIPISGPELAQLVMATVAKDLAAWQHLGECAAFPGARVDFAIHITTQPVEEGKVLKYRESYTLDLAQPPDVLRIIAGIPLWGVVKVALDGLDQQVEVATQPSAELKKAALGLVSKNATTTAPVQAPAGAPAPKLPVGKNTQGGGR